LLKTVTMQNVACVPQRDAGHDAGQRDRQDDQQGHGVAAEEVIPRQRERGHRAEHERNHRRQGCDPQAHPESVAGTRRGEGAVPPFEGEAGRRPRERAAGVEGVEDDDPQRHVDHDQGQDRARQQGEP
jgi:hypothetical protein